MNDFHARQYTPSTLLFDQPDVKAADYPWLNPYLYCAANPLRFVDPDGKAWRVLQDENEGTFTGYEWIDEKDSYDKKGDLLPGLYHFAIFFSCEGKDGKKFNPNENYNIGTSIATVYKQDGTTTEYEACTLPSDCSKFPIIPEGLYEAMVGKHNGGVSSYMALRMSDVGTENFSNSSIELGAPNPRHPDTTKAIGINIHKPGLNNFTGKDSKGNYISEGCFLIDRNSWDSFINEFSPNTRISIINSRTLKTPTNKLK